MTDRTGRAGRILALILLGLCLASLTPFAPAQEPASWRGYRVFLWTFGDRELGARFFGTLAALHIGGINREGAASPEVVRQAGFSYYAGHATVKSILHLRRPEFEARWKVYRDHRDAGHLIRPYCLNEPRTREALRARLAATVETHGPDGPAAWSLGDEISITQRVTPLDFCYCPHCLAALRTWLTARYGTLEALNEAWRTRFETWAEVVPFTADRIKDRERRMPRGRRALGPWADHRAFMDRTLAETIARLRDQARALGVRRPVGILGGQAPAPYGGYDWGRLLRVVDWVEAYDQGGAMEVVRGLGPECIRVRTYFKAGGGEALNRFRLFKYFAHGDRGAILWSDREILDATGAPTAYARGIAPVLERLASPEASAIAALPVATDGVSLYYSQASIRVTWFNDSRRDGRSWLNRFGSHEAAHSTHYRRREAWHRLLEDLGLQYGWVDSRTVAEGGVPPGVKVLVLPEVSRIEPAEMKGLQRFLDRGGWILADRPGPALRTVLAHDRTTVLRARMLRYLDQRVGGPGESARREVLKALALGEVTGPCRATRVPASAGKGAKEKTPPPPEGVGLEVIRRPAAKGTYYFVLVNPTPAEERGMTAAAWTRPFRVRVEFARPVRARGVFGSEGWDGKAIEHTMSGDRPWVFFVEQP